MESCPVINHDNVIQSGDLGGLLSVLSKSDLLYRPANRHVVDGVKSQLSVCGWHEMLFKDNDPVDSDALFLMDGVLHGFKLVDPGVEMDSYISENYHSASVQSKDEMDVLIKTELLQGKLKKVIDRPVCVHAMGAIKKSSGKISNITDCSRPEGSSINSFMNETFSTFSYKSVDTVVDMLQPGDSMAVTDISNAYRSVMIRPCDRTKQGLSWILDGEQIYMEDCFLSFGTRAAPFIFSRITDAVVRHLGRLGIRAVNYLDDSIVLGKSWCKCRDAQLVLQNILRRLGFYIAYPKVISPSQTVIYLGIQIDSVDMKLIKASGCKTSETLQRVGVF